MKKLYSLLTLLVVLCSTPTFSQLVAGDIAFIGMNEDTNLGLGQNDDFSWIALKDIPAGTQIYFTEQGVNTTDWFANTEGHIRWTAPVGGTPCGTVVNIFEDIAIPNLMTASSGTVTGPVSFDPLTSWNLNGGDQVLAYVVSSGSHRQANFANTTFIAGIHLNDDQVAGETNGWTATTYVGTGTAECMLPPGLTNGTNCISLFSGAGNPEFDNVKFTGSLVGTAAVVRAAINTAFIPPSPGAGGWQVDDLTPFNITPAGYAPNVTCAPPPCADGDGDTYTDIGCGGTDCNDANAAINPGATEICDGIDNDCDLGIDEGQANFDGDGFCDLIDPDDDNDGSLDGPDCNDFNAFILPGAPEITCNGIDENCNGPVDDGTPVTYYRDADGDTYGTAGTTTISCTGPPAGFVANNTDCDDSNGSRNPGATEICDGIDNDCDATTDEGQTNTDGLDQCDAIDPDDDNDGVADGADNTPLNPDLCRDLDSDGCDDCSVGTDNFGALADFNTANDGIDTDNDGLCNSGDPDDDNDGVADGSDNTPLNPDLCRDLDLDGCDDCAVGTDNLGPLADFSISNDGTDVDGDGYCTATDCADNNAAINPGATEICDGIDNNCAMGIDEGQINTDGDAQCDAIDSDDDNDGVADVSDINSLDPDFCIDSDGDGCDDCAVGTDDFGPMADNTPLNDGTDMDGDGYCTATDCADNNAAINPGAVEICDGIDNNCTLGIDEGLGIDLDGDTHGDPLSCVTDPSIPVYDDCDDADATNYPTNPEVCDNSDNDCDLVIDNGLGFDLDGDLHADATSCATDATLVLPYDDCDDADATNYPTNPEVCDNLDNDCDLVIDNGLGVDLDGDLHADATSCATDATLVLPYDDCDDADANNYPTNPEVCDNSDNDCDLVIDNGLGFDLDGDLHADATSCATDATLLLPYDDCDDADANNYPTNPEVCDNSDNDCDLVIDNGLGFDLDGDLHADATSCATDATLVLPYDDCDDADANNYPTNPEVCDNSDNDCDLVIDNGLGFDADGDLHADATSCATDATLLLPYDDCDDADANNYPTNPEVCDNSDNDCDLVIDNGLGVDADGDLHADATSCATDATLVLPYDDCDDADATNYPTNPEVCDNADNDCDLVIDNGLGFDLDGDLHADATSCATDATLVLPYDDCDDADANNYPTNPEVCDNADNDCDGIVDNGLGIDNDLDGHGDPGSCTTDGSLLIPYDDCDDAAPNNYPGNAEVCDGLDNDCDGLIDSADPSSGDSDADGLLSCDEVFIYGTNPNDNDTDGDGLEDNEILVFGTDPLDFDTDDDGINDYSEIIVVLTDPLDVDTDNDGVQDGTEIGLAGGHPTDTDPLIFIADADGGVTTTDPLNPDTDGGGLNDGVEDVNFNGVVDMGENDPNLTCDDIDLDGDGDDSCTDCDDTDPILNTLDTDMDGVSSCAGDCDDFDANNFPGNIEICDGQDNDCNAGTDEGFDVDGDGFTTCAGDCNDTDAAINPLAIEVCDGQDNDCNGLTDEGFDLDLDGVTTCAGDCDDADANNFPGNPEVCDVADNDCDLVIDNGLGFDLDGDLHADATSCATDATLLLPYDDCDDTDPNNYPTNPEVCDNSDNDCDLVIDNGLGFDLDGDLHADATSCATDATLLLPYDDCDDTDANNFPGNPEVCDNSDNDCDLVIDNGLGVDADGDGDGDPASCPTDGTLLIPYADCNDAIAVLNSLDNDGDGFSTCAGDCNDMDPNNFPFNVEVCDGVDNNCDAVIDEGLGIDADGDGDGDPASCPTDETLVIPYTDCDDTDPVLNSLDLDSDGVSSCAGDCDDADPTTFLGAMELCDGLDNDCDLVIDNGLGIDADGDGHGDPLSCTTDGSLLIPYDDCDDTDANNYPTNTEVCDNADNDCDLVIDNGLGIDADGDSHGDPLSCTTDGSLLIPYDDCNDSDATIFMGAMELCDVLDNDCDLVIDEGLGIDADGDLHGDPFSCTTDATLLIPYDDCDDSNASVFPGAAEVCDVLDNDCDLIVDGGLGLDLDGDGHGDPLSCVTDASLPIPYDDCDDTDANNYPTNPEVCDNADNDCDLVIDNGLGFDLDGDLHADATSCATDATLLLPYDDCDDTDANNYPTNPEVCDNSDNDCDGVVDNGLGVDADGDLHGDPFSCATDATLLIPYDDCDDTDANNYPTNPEVCDNADNDCDGVVDNGLGVDADGDLHGDPLSCVTDATLLIPYDDCDDTDANNYPTNPEVCDNADNDCDGVVDNGLGFDLDGDLHADATSCATDATLVLPYDDCDDTDPNNYPTNPEVCDNSDNDCDGVVDNGLGVDADGDGHGDPLSCVTDASLPIPYDDCDDTDANNYPTNPEVCDNADNDCDGVVDNGLGFDLDGDLHADATSCATDATLVLPYDDCDDTDPNNYPTNPEVCDNSDNDCDGVVDNGLGVDADGDGHGDPLSCTTDATLLIPYDDCDDTDANNYPTNPEVCDNADNDCDGVVDNGLGFDLDGDLHADATSCATDATLVLPYDDCDDTDANNYPTNPEVCDNSDNDCDGVVDNGLGVDADGDGHGDPLSCVTDASLPIPYDDCDDTDANNFAGNPEICDNADNDCDGVVDNGLGIDADGDGHGDPTSCTTDASLPIPYDDCDDTNPLVFGGNDADLDLLDDCVEISVHGTDPLNFDTDGDGLDDGTEVNTTLTDPLNVDTDGDFLSDGDEVNIVTTDPLDADTDDDGLVDGNEVNIFGTDPLNTDTDGDGIQDGTELGEVAGHPTDTDLLVFIPDGDGGALTSATDPLNPDTDGGGLSDGVEDANFNGVVDPGETHPLIPCDDADADGDGIDSCFDCDDNDANNFPGNVEICDAQDNNCDTQIDEGFDLDGDGFTTCANDCNDGDPTINPGMVEIGCDGIDNDCDALTLDILDNDGDTETCDTDCDDSNAFLNNLDLDGDTETTCAGDCDDSDPVLNTFDLDADGFSSCAGDCDDFDATVNPAAVEIGCDGIDNDCNPFTSDNLDNDGDTETCATDCDDTDPFLNNLDLDADGQSTCAGDCDDADPIANTLDTDGDGFTSCAGDCNDFDASVNPAAVEIGCDGIDNDCNPATSDILDNDGDTETCDTDCDDTDPFFNNLDNDGDLGSTCGGDCDDNSALLNILDLDGDGVTTCAGDCDDLNSASYPGNMEVCDGQDNNCDGFVDEGFDMDNDGVSVCQGDCNDLDPNNYPTNTEICDFQDNNCNGFIDEGFDVDGDGVSVCQGDCDDNDPNNFPGNMEVCDGQDNDCDGIVPANEIDSDTDGQSTCQGDCDDSNPFLNQLDLDNDGITSCAGDCNDSNTSMFPGNMEVCDGVDNNCNGLVDEGFDMDGDGVSSCAGDCDDTNPNNYPGNIEVCDFQDNNCNGMIDEGFDLDADGVTTCAGDCNDLNPTIYAGAFELCDELDNNCDGFIPTDEIDLDNDGLSTCQGDCDDSNPNLNQIDLDGDGVTSCQGDCNDNNPNNFPGNFEACDFQDNNCNGMIDEGYDMDGDGVTSCAGDCDDTNPTIYPGAFELCDGIDNNCDGFIPPTEFDMDGDGVTSCQGDCNDFDPNNFPGNIETCDGQDNDCDGIIDNNVVFIDYYPDFDGDGFGDAFAPPTSTCDGAPFMFVANNADCNDSNPMVFPGAFELCDGLDNNCDGIVPSTEIDDDGDGLAECQGDCNDFDPNNFPGNIEICDGQDNNCDGFVPANEFDMDGDGVTLCQGDCDDSNPNNFPGNTETCDGLDNDCDGIADNGLVFIDYYADFDGDGFGNPGSMPVSTCDGPPAGFVANNSDCNDANPTIYPTAPELCDGLDNNCDGITPIDELDIDADGFSTCQGDCNDGNASINPAMTEITCNGIDDDCNPATMDDLGAPMMMCQNATVFLNASGSVTITPATINAGSFDDCGIATITISQSTFNCSHLGPNPVTLTITDVHGNVGSCVATVTVVDPFAPVPTLPALSNVFAQCQVSALIAPTAADNCSGLVVGTHNATLPITAQGTTVVTWTYNDGNGNISTQTQNVVLDDVTAPVPVLATLPTVTAQCEVASLTSPAVVDNCSGIVIVTHNASLPITNQGTTVVTWTYNDGNGNITTQTQLVVIDDVTAPVPVVATLPNQVGQCQVTTLPAPPTATDNCTGGIITGTTTATGPWTTQGTHVITWTFTDGNGNSSTQNQNIVVDDVTAPVANVAVLPNVTQICSATPAAPAATDNCVGTIVGTTTTTFPITTVGTTTVIWSYNDGNGNITTQSQAVIITGVDVSLSVSPDGATITANNGSGTYQWINCATNLPVGGGSAQEYTATANGTYAVVITQAGCSDTSACITVSTVGVEDLTIDNLIVYPNPSADGYFTVSYDGEIKSIDVIDMLGRTIQLPTDVTTGVVDGSGLAYGKYMVRVITEDGILTTEVLIAR